MVSWVWVLIALMAGTMFGIVLRGLMEISRRSEDNERW